MAPVTLADVEAAAARLDGVLDPTPLALSRALSTIAGGPIHLKCENLQRTGSFKIRGAYNRIAQLSEVERVRGVVCASAGNHAQGVALAARLVSVASTVFMPEQAALPKVEATENYGATVRLVGTSFEDALIAAQSFAQSEGSVFVHPFDDDAVIAGQGTIGLEIKQQLPSAQTVVVPVGGGGLISGIAVALKARGPDVRVIGVQAAGAATMTASLAAGEPQSIDRADTIADGIAVTAPCERTLAHVRDLVDEVVLVSEDEIARAVVNLLERGRLVVEPAGAAGVAALLGGHISANGPTAVVLSGGNIDPMMLHRLVSAGLTAEGRFATLKTELVDRPGELHRLLGVIAEHRVNVVAVDHHRIEPRQGMRDVEVLLELETRGPEHTEGLLDALRAAGYTPKPTNL